MSVQARREYGSAPVVVTVAVVALRLMSTIAATIGVTLGR